MFSIQKSSAQLQKKDSMDNEKEKTGNLETKCRVYITLTPPSDKQHFLRCPLRSPITCSKSVPQRSRSFHRYKAFRSLSSDISGVKKHTFYRRSPSLGLEKQSCGTKKLQDMSRSAQIMRALSHYRDESIKRSLTFDSSPNPSPKRNSSGSSFEASVNTGVEVDAISPVTGNFLRLMDTTNSNDSSIDSMLVASSESIDENQNQTPQRNQKLVKIRSDRKKNQTDKSVSSSRNSSLRNCLKEKIDEIVETSRSESMHKNERSRASSSELSPCIQNYIVTSRSRNLYHEFDKNRYNSPTTPKNMSLSPESPSVGENSRKKERLFCREEQSTRRIENFVKDGDLYKERMESSDTSNSYNMTLMDGSQKKDTENIKSNDCEKCEENTRDISLPSNRSNKKEDHSNAREDKEDCSYSPEESSNARNVDVTEQRNREESNPATSRDSNGAVTPENRINIIQRILTESIKKSHKKVKHDNKKTLFKSNFLGREIYPAGSEISVQGSRGSDANRCENTKGKSIRAATPRNCSRPSTPEDRNSSRLLLSQFSSIKKSHRKDKRNNDNKRVLDFPKCSDKYQDCRKKNIDLLRVDNCEKKYTSKTLHTSESPRLKELSPDISFTKRKRTTNESFGSQDESSFQSPFPECSKNLNDEFKIYTPIGRRASPFYITKRATDETSPREDEFARSAVREADYSRCSTPIPRSARLLNIKSKRSEFKRRICTGAKKLDNETRITSDNVPMDTTAAALTNEDGRSTPINMSTIELLCNIDSIKKSHRKDKDSRGIHRRRISKNKQSKCTGEETTNVLKEHIMPTFSGPNINADHEDYEVTTILDDPQPSTSRQYNENEVNVEESKSISTTPPNSWNTMNLIKRLRTTSIKKSHKKERNYNAQAKYILMNEEHNVSDDGSIFGEEDRLTSVDADFNSCQDSDNEKTYSCS